MLKTDKHKAVVVIDGDETSGFVSERILLYCGFAENVYRFNHPSKVYAFLESFADPLNCPEIIFTGLFFSDTDGISFVREFSSYREKRGIASRLVILSSAILPWEKEQLEKIEPGIQCILKPLSAEALARLKEFTSAD